MSKKIQPLRDTVVVKQFTEQNISEGGIVIPNPDKRRKTSGIVISVGAGRPNPMGDILPMKVKEHDVVMFGAAIRSFTVDDEDYLLMKEDNILAIVEHQ